MEITLDMIFDEIGIDIFIDNGRLVNYVERNTIENSAELFKIDGHYVEEVTDLEIWTLDSIWE